MSFLGIFMPPFAVLSFLGQSCAPGGRMVAVRVAIPLSSTGLIGLPALLFVLMLKPSAPAVSTARGPGPAALSKRMNPGATFVRMSVLNLEERVWALWKDGSPRG